MVFIYILLCKEDSYYVGKTNNPEFRIENHVLKSGSSFTKKYPVISLYQLIPDCDDFDEDKYVKKYMCKHGIDKVRGGSYSKLVLDGNDIEFLKKEIRGASDTCFICGGNHFVTECPNKQKELSVSFNGSNCNNQEQKREISKTSRSKCQKCKEIIKKDEYRIGEESSYRGQPTTKWFHEKCHSFNSISQDRAYYEKSTECPNKQKELSVSFNGSNCNNQEQKREISKTSRSKCQKCKEIIKKDEYRIGEESSYRGQPTTKWFHEKCHSFNSISQDRAYYEKSTENKYATTEVCYRCGREGHYSNTCYAKKDINGSYINDCESSEEDDVCYRCGREGHYSNTCYSKKDINGSYINN